MNENLLSRNEIKEALLTLKMNNDAGFHEINFNLVKKYFVEKYFQDITAYHYIIASAKIKIAKIISILKVIEIALVEN